MICTVHTAQREHAESTAHTVRTVLTVPTVDALRIARSEQTVSIAHILRAVLIATAYTELTEHAQQCRPAFIDQACATIGGGDSH